MELDTINLVNEIEELKSRVYNLTLYLKDAIDDDYQLLKYLVDKYDGMPGYNHAFFVR